MIYDLQKASTLKRLSAYILDLILLIVLITGVASILSAALGFDGYNSKLDACYQRYEQEYGIALDITQEEFNSLTEEERARYEEANTAMSKDEEAIHIYNMILNLILIIMTFSVLIGYVILEILVPRLIGNGQTIGKKVFGLALMRTNGVKINTVCLCIRTILGKYTIETMVPLLLVIMVFFGVIGIVAPIVILGLLLLQVIMMIVTHTNSAIHDLLADTVVVDIASQMMFNSELEMLDYKKKVAAERASRQKY